MEASADQKTSCTCCSPVNGTRAVSSAGAWLWLHDDVARLPPSPAAVKLLEVASDKHQHLQAVDASFQRHKVR